MLDRKELTAKLESLSNNARRNKRNKYFVFLIVVIGAMSPFLAYAIDTEIFPVTTRLTAIILEESAPDVTAISLLYTKRRNCKIQSVGFYSNGAAIRMIETLDTGPLMNRPLGKNQSRVFRMKISREDFIDHGIVQFEHRCHPLWTHRKIVFGD